MIAKGRLLSESISSSKGKCKILEALTNSFIAKTWKNMGHTLPQMACNMYNLRVNFKQTAELFYGNIAVTIILCPHGIISITWWKLEGCGAGFIDRVPTSFIDVK